MAKMMCMLYRGWKSEQLLDKWSSNLTMKGSVNDDDLYSIPGADKVEKETNYGS